MTIVDLTLQRTEVSAPKRSEPSASYDICYVDGTGRLLATHCVSCATDKKACILAHAMRPHGTRRIEVWRGPCLVYERPQTARAATLEALRPAQDSGLPRLGAWQSRPER